MAELVPFATIEQLEAGWRKLSPEDEVLACELIMRASAQLTAEMAHATVPIDPDDPVQAYNIMSCTCAMVRNAMSSGPAEGIASMSQTIGGTAASVSWSNPNGDFYIPKFYRGVLGIAASGKYRSVAYRTYADQM